MRPTHRRRIVISFVASAAAHAGLLAWVSLRVPDLPKSPRIIQQVSPIRASASEPEPRELIVQIQPPGVLPSGGGPSAAADRSSPDAALTLAPIGVPEVTLPDVAAPSRGILLASAASSPIELPSVGSERNVESPRPSRPNRGIIQRPDGAGGDTGRGGRESIGSAGAGRGSNGVTIAGPGTDCITAGLASPAGRIPLVLPSDRRRGPGATGLGGVRIGRPRR